MRAVWIGLTVLLAVTAALFAVSNTETVSVGLWPIPDELHLPAYLVILAALGLGFGLGRVSGWFAHGRVRRDRRRLRRHVETLEAARPAPVPSRELTPT